MTDAWQARFRLALGGAAEPSAELPSASGYRLFEARRPGESSERSPTRFVVLHSADAESPRAGPLLDRMASIHALANSALAGPLAVGEWEGQAWVVEPRPEGSTLARRLEEVGTLRMAEMIRILRDLARAVAAMHRRGLVHAELNSAHVYLSPRGTTRLAGLGRATNGSSHDDLRALGRLAMAMTGGPPSGEGATWAPAYRLPAGLDRVIRGLVHEAPPPDAEELLAALDHHPTRRGPSLVGFFEGSDRSARLPAARRGALILGVVGALALLLVWVLSRLG